MPPLAVKWEASWTSVPALESVPVLGAVQKAPQRNIFPGSPGSGRETHQKESRDQKDIRTDESKDIRPGTSAVVGETRELVTTDQLEVALDGALTGRAVGTEPGSVSKRAARDAIEVRVGVGGIGLGGASGGVDLGLPGRRAPIEGSPLAVDASDSKVARQPNASRILDFGEEVLGGAIGIDIGEEVRWFDGVIPGTSSSKVVRSGYW